MKNSRLALWLGGITLIAVIASVVVYPFLLPKYTTSLFLQCSSSTVIDISSILPFKVKSAYTNDNAGLPPILEGAQELEVQSAKLRCGQALEVTHNKTLQLIASQGSQDKKSVLFIDPPLPPEKMLVKTYTNKSGIPAKIQKYTILGVEKLGSNFADVQVIYSFRDPAYMAVLDGSTHTLIWIEPNPD